MLQIIGKTTVFFACATNLVFTMDEGYIKFRAHLQATPPYPTSELHELIRWRQYYYDMAFIGAYTEQIGYGNISQRCTGQGDQFYISGSATGLLPTTDEWHYAKVVNVEAASNELWCEGPLLASSESMSHAAIYQELPEVNAILHAHHRALWEAMLHQVPTTAADAPYGSPEMVKSILSLIKNTELPQVQVFVMEGHEEGLFFFGRDFSEIAGIVMDVVDRFGGGAG